MRYFLFILVFLAFVAPVAYAQQHEEEEIDLLPPLDEYDNVKAGVMMPEKSATLPGTEGENPEGSPDEIGRAMTYDDIMDAYRAGKFDVAIKYTPVLAEAGDIRAQELMGIIYRNGQGIAKDPEKALYWLTKAAEANRPLAQHHLGIMNYIGEAVPENTVKSVMWLYIAIAHYPEGAEKTRAQQDFENVNGRLTRRDKMRARQMAHDWLDRRGEGQLLSAEQ